MKISEKIKLKRIQKGLNQKELAKMIGVAHATINKIELGKTENPSVDIAIKIADALGTDVYELFSDVIFIPKSLLNNEVEKYAIENFKIRLVYSVDNFFNGLLSPILLKLRVETDPLIIEKLEKESKEIEVLQESLFLHLSFNGLLTNEDRIEYYRKIETLKSSFNFK